MQEQIKENRKELRESAAQSAALVPVFSSHTVLENLTRQQPLVVTVMSRPLRWAWATVSQRMWQEKLQLLQVGHPHRGMLV